MNRITELFQRKDRNLLSVYFTAGYPVLEDTVEIIQMLENRGVDLVEIGIPFSDPMADGVVIQQSSTQALKNGMTLPVLLEQLTSIRSRVELPLLLMGYLNPMLQYGMENLFRKGMEIGIDGMIIPDLPFQEYLESVKPLCEKYDIPVIMLITPETSDERIRLIDEYCGGFIYMVSSASTTGAVAASSSSLRSSSSLFASSSAKRISRRLRTTVMRVAALLFSAEMRSSSRASLPVLYAPSCFTASWVVSFLISLISTS